MSEQLQIPQVWFALYYGGVRMAFTLPLVGENPALDAQLQIDYFLGQGYTIDPPAGDVPASVYVIANPEWMPEDASIDRLDIEWIIKGEVTNERGTTQRVWAYAPWGQDQFGSQMTIYLNTPDEEQLFERFSGVELASLPLCSDKKGPIKSSKDFDTYSRPAKFTVYRYKDHNGFWKLYGYDQRGAGSFAHQQAHVSNGTQPEPEGDAPAWTYDKERANWNINKLVAQRAQFGFDAGQKGAKEAMEFIHVIGAQGLLADDLDEEQALAILIENQ